jgi:two-component system, NtrC family, sensor histidine kinase PilS
MMPTLSLRATPSGENFWRTLQTFNITRLLISLVLFLYTTLNAKKGVGAGEQFIYREMCIIYLAIGILFVSVAVYYRRRFLLQLVAQLSIDIIVISVLYVAAGGGKSGLAILYLFPLAGSAILAPLVLALSFVSAVTLILLTESVLQVLEPTADVSVSQAGLYGAAFFIAVFAINRLAARLIKQETLAMQRGRDLQIQEAINHVVIADMRDGILVVGRDSTLLTANPAAEQMLGFTIAHDTERFSLTGIPYLRPIAEAFFAWTAHSVEKNVNETSSSTFVVIKPVDEPGLQHAMTPWGNHREWLMRLKLRFAVVETNGLAEDRTVIFLQDVSEIENQAQQLKLASMGRLTASIAHEVRNPLSAISYAASLLAEELVMPAHIRLLNIVGDNVERLNQLIEDILKLSRKAQLYETPLSIEPFCAEIVAEFQERQGLPPGLIDVGDMKGHRVRFDPLHLRQVVVNLLSNAIRYASGGQGSIRIHVVTDAASRLELHVHDDGVAITPDVRAHLFEPFYTTSSKGTGLGLYVARELCLNNGAMLDYEYRLDAIEDVPVKGAGRFVITFSLLDAF